MLRPVRNIDEYKRIKEALRDKFEKERTGEHNLFIEQSKLLQPLIEPLIATQEQTVKAIQDRGPPRAAKGSMEVQRSLPWSCWRRRLRIPSST